jgi:hypothetical protein
LSHHSPTIQIIQIQHSAQTSAAGLIAAQQQQCSTKFIKKPQNNQQSSHVIPIFLFLDLASGARDTDAILRFNFIANSSFLVLVVAGIDLNTELDQLKIDMTEDLANQYQEYSLVNLLC